MHRVRRLLLVTFIINRQRDHHRLLNEVGSVDDRVSVKLPEVFDLVDPLEIQLHFLVGFEVRVPDTLLDRMTYLFAANAADILEHLLGFDASAIIVIVNFIVLGLMFAELAARLFFPPFAAAPPHLAAPVRLVSATRPVEILFFNILVGAVFTSFHSLAEITFALDQLGDPEFQSIPFLRQLFDFFLLPDPLFKVQPDFLNCRL